MSDIEKISQVEHSYILYDQRMPLVTYDSSSSDESHPEDSHIASKRHPPSVEAQSDVASTSSSGAKR